MALAQNLLFSINMRIVILTSQKKFWLTLVAVIVTVTVLFFATVGVVLLYILYQDSDIGNGHNVVLGRDDDFHIRKDGKIIVSPTMIDWDIVSEYVVGLRLPAEHLECDGGYRIRLKNKKEYFVLHTKNGDVFNFISRDAFEGKLKELGIFNDVSLRYIQFENVWNHYSESYYKNIDYSACVPIKYE